MTTGHGTAWRAPNSPIDLLRVLHDQVAQYSSPSSRIAEDALKHLFWSMFESQATDDVWEQVGIEITEQLTRACVKSIRVADAFWIKDGMMTVVQNALNSLFKAGHNDAQIEAHLPVSDHGFVWFEKPIKSPSWVKNGLPVEVVAQSWHVVSDIPCRDANKPGEPLIHCPGFLQVLWTTRVQWARDIAPSILMNATDELVASIARYGPYLLPVAASGVPFNSRLTPLDDPASSQLSEFVGPLTLTGLWILMNDVVQTDTRKAGLPSAVRKHYAARLKHPNVRVVTLRRTKNVGDPTHHEAMVREWTHRWVVESFWRHLPGESGCHGAGAVPGEDQEHCANCGGRITHVMNHVKGPQGLPLQVKEVVYSVSR